MVPCVHRNANKDILARVHILKYESTLKSFQAALRTHVLRPAPTICVRCFI